MTDREIDLITVKVMAEILKHVTWEGDDICVGGEGLKILKNALRLASVWPSEHLRSGE